MWASECGFRLPGFKILIWTLVGKLSVRGSEEKKKKHSSLIHTVSHALASWVQISRRHVKLSTFVERDHDFGKKSKSDQHSNFPYMFPNQVV